MTSMVSKKKLFIALNEIENVPSEIYRACFFMSKIEIIFAKSNNIRLVAYLLKMGMFINSK